MNEVRIGVDPHKASHTASVMDGRGRVLDQRRFPSTRQGFRATLRWADRWPQRSWAIEGAEGLGLRLAQTLVHQREVVVSVPATLVARVRQLSTGNGRKNDPADARAVARVAWSEQRLTTVEPEGGVAVVGLYNDRRSQVVASRTRLVNQLHILLRDLGLVTGKELQADHAAKLLASCRPSDEANRARKALARDVVADIRRTDTTLAKLAEPLAAAVKATGTRLTELFGVGDVLAARFLAEVGNVARFSSAAHFASYNGTAPIEVSSGEVVRHRLSRVGNRRLNAALHVMAIVQISHPTPGQAYYRRKLTEGKTRKEALRCLKRRLSDVVYRVLVADARVEGPGSQDGDVDWHEAPRAAGSHPHTDSSRTDIPGRSDPIPVPHA